MFEIKWILFWGLIIGCFVLGGIAMALSSKKREKGEQGVDGREGRKRAISQVGLYLFMFTLIQLPSIAMAILVSFLIFMSVRELYGAFENRYPGQTKHPEYYVSQAWLPLYPWAALYVEEAVPYFLGLYGLLSLLLLVLGQRTEQIGVSLLLLCLSLGCCLAFQEFAFLRQEPNGAELCIFFFFLVNMGDVMALITGYIWGKVKLLPKVSPNKTVEGSLGSLLASMFLSLAFCYILELPFSPLESLLAGAVINMLGQLGDLFFSLIKREANVKDFGALIPGHGGVLDRFDSVLMVLPFFAFFMSNY